MRGLILVSALIGALAVPSARAAETFTARLTTVPIDLSMKSAVTGSGQAKATLDGRRLVISGTFSGMQGPATHAELLEGSVTGVRGRVIHPLTVDFAPAGTLSGRIELTPEQADSLRNGRLYVQIASEKAPDGNLWGWFLH